MMTVRSTTIVLLLLLTGMTAWSADSTQVDPATPPCATSEFRQFDFWLGNWDLTWSVGDSVQKGTNTITADLGGCVIEENFTTHDAEPFVGRSLSVYDPHDQLWRQTWVDNSGNYLDFAGGLQSDSMILSRRANRADSVFYQRMVFYNIGPDSLDWSWESAPDSTGPWTPLWEIHYQRQK